MTVLTSTTQPSGAVDRGDEEPVRHLTLFNHPGYHGLVAPAEDRRRVDHYVDGRLIGSWTGTVVDGGLVSGHSAPMGGPDTVSDDAPLPEVEGLVDLALTRWRDEGLRSVETKARSGAWSTADRHVVQALLSRGSRVTTAHLCHQIPLCHLDGTDAWISTLSKRYRTYVRRSVEMIEVAPASTEAEWLAAHDTLRRNKARKDREMALTPAAMLGTRQAFPDQVRMLVVRVEGDIVAAALTYLVRPGIELLVNWGDREHDLPTSPMPGLMWHMVRRGLDEGVRWLDLGISSEADGTPNHGLAFFKTRFGATTELRLDLTLEL
ncbi:MAG: GNAT family N-acetyltransferase [Actinomycetota bacterium]